MSEGPAPAGETKDAAMIEDGIRPRRRELSEREFRIALLEDLLQVLAGSWHAAP